jgi:hypothetical protein
MKKNTFIVSSVLLVGLFAISLILVPAKPPPLEVSWA